MFKYVVYAQNGRGRWNLLRSSTEPDKPAYFQTVLSLSHDPDLISGGSRKADSYIQYRGPMYLDFDGEDQGAELVAVIADAKKVVHKIMLDYTVNQQDMRIYLTGGRGLHVEIDAERFGMTKPQVKLPKIWGLFADKFKSKYIDRSIYSMGRGRMWRVPGLQRTNGKYKVQISYEELMTLETVEQYDLLCSVPRPPLASTEPKVNKYLKAEFDRLRQTALAEEDADIYALRDRTTDAMKAIQGVPGCIEKLITEGDCHDSNWNQAAMQVAAYCAAKYVDETYVEEVVEPFLNNVESSSRPTYTERKSSLDFLLDRAFSGSIQFFTGALIKTIGKPCGSCPICKPDKVESFDEDGEVYIDYPNADILSMKGGTFRTLGEGKKTKLIVGGLQMLQTAIDLYTGHAVAFTVGIENKVKTKISVDTFAHPKEFNLTLMRVGYTFLGVDGDLKRLSQACLQYHLLNEEHEVTYASTVAGIQIRDVEVTEYSKNGLPEKRIKKVPYLVSRDGVFTADSGAPPVVSEFMGKAAWTPAYLTKEHLTPSDLPKLNEVFSSLLKINEPFNVMTIIGFMTVAHLRAHLREMNNQFPLLNLNGTSETGKSSTLFLMHTLNGFEYGTTPVWNAEVDTPYPLEDMISTSTTFVRVIEEVNEGTAKKNWSKLTGILKSAWDGQGIDKGTLVNGQAATKTLPNWAPVVFLSEQPHPVDSVRSRSIVCKFKSSVVRDPKHANPFRTAVKSAKYLEMLGRALMTKCVAMSIEEVCDKLKGCEEILEDAFQARSHTMYSYIFLGLLVMEEALESLGAEVREFSQMRAEYINHILEHAEELSDTRKESRLDEILSAFDTMAYEYDSPVHGLVAGNHYWKQRNTLYFDPRLIFPRYRRYLKGVGQEGVSSIVAVTQFMDMVEREDYFMGYIQHPHRARSRIMMLDLNAMAERNISTSSYEDSLPDGS